MVCYAVIKFCFHLQEFTSFPLTLIRPIQFRTPQSINLLILWRGAATVHHNWQHNFWTALRIYVLRTPVPSAWRLTKVTKVRSLPTTTNGEKEISSFTFTPHKYSHPDVCHLIITSFGVDIRKREFPLTDRRGPVGNNRVRIWFASSSNVGLGTLSFRVFFLQRPSLCVVVFFIGVLPSKTQHNITTQWYNYKISWLGLHVSPANGPSSGQYRRYNRSNKVALSGIPFRRE